MRKVILLIVVGAAFGVSLVTAHILPAKVEGGERQVSDLTVGSANAHRLNIEAPLAQVVLIADGTGELMVHAVRSSKRPFDEASRKWMKDSYITARNKDGVLSVRDHPFGSDELWSTFENDSKGSTHGAEKDFELELDIHVPAYLATNLKVAFGTVNVNGRFQSFDADLAAGTLIVQGVRSEKTINLNVGAGEVNDNLDAHSHGGSNLRLGAGEVKLVIPAGASTEVTASVGTGEISGLPKSDHDEDKGSLGDRRRGKVGRGDQKVEIEVGTGEIKVTSGDRPQAVSGGKWPVESVIESDDCSVGDERALPADIRHTVRSAVRTALSDARKAMRSVDAELEYEFKESREDSFQSVDDVGPALRRALSDIGPAVHRAMRKARPEIARALHRAARAVERAKRELDRPEGL